jgi:hypothetical protein
VWALVHMVKSREKKEKESRKCVSIPCLSLCPVAPLCCVRAEARRARRYRAEAQRAPQAQRRPSGSVKLCVCVGV